MDIIGELISPFLWEIFLSFEQVLTMRKENKEWAGQENAQWAASLWEQLWRSMASDPAQLHSYSGL